MENLKNYLNHANLVALLCYIAGRLANIGILCWIGLLIMTIVSIYTIIHWKENQQLTNYIAVAFLILVALSFIGI